MSEEEQKTILKVRDLSVEFQVRGKTLKAIHHVSLDLHDGETLAIVGESGSGKSVLTKTFTGMLEQNGQVSGGTIEYNGQMLTDLKNDKQWVKIRGKEIATVFQDPMTSLDPIHTIGSQISEVIVKHQGKSKSEAKKMAIELMGRTGIPDAAERYGDYPFEYSGGMRQRIVIAIALACHPKILICDEPTTALDVTTQAQILDLIRDLKEEYHFSIIFITHDLGVVASIADRIAVMYSGRLIEVGTVDEIFYDPRHPYTWSLLSSLPQLATKDTNLYSIPGTPPSLYSEIKGDAFAPRDPYALKVDFEREPPLFKITDTHYARTWLLDPRAPKIEKPEIIQNLHERIEKQMESDFMKRAETEGEVNAS
ncbi:ABC transporter ATP-binding protein [Schleiferilactobacillus perolens]|jgi:oligopeptide transport system ATP-binding protein|uniref:ABC transporter ATP-binding protein n=1 Tax=Schleiferilactobacillus perolens TaxID=100468 RepID=UPI0023535BD5|nr:ABC transporter ATP-binding protein [Schleiferilactobacillus perolens]MCI2171930.1 ABC transporter ATP-binding protein [Schleiferilactobacillus perolens]